MLDRRTALSFATSCVTLSASFFLHAGCSSNDTITGATSTAAGGTSATSAGGTSAGGTSAGGGSPAAGGSSSTQGQGGSTTTGGQAGATTVGQGGVGPGAGGNPAGGSPTGTGGNGASGGSGGSGGGTAGSGGSTTGKTFCSLPTPAPAGITAPPGFCVHSYAGDSVTSVSILQGRTIRFAPNGDPFIASPAYPNAGGNHAGTGTGAILVLPDDDHDGIADSVVTYAGGAGESTGSSCELAENKPKDLSCVHGLAFADGFLYYTRYNEMRRFPYKTGDRARPAGMVAGDFVSSLGMDAPGSWRWTHTIDKGTDGTLWVTRGQFEASCDAQTLKNGAVLSIDPTTLPANPTVLADGFRNPMYIRCNGKKQCFANELTGDGWGGPGQSGREKVALITPDTHWGFPCCYTTNLPLTGIDPSMCTNVAPESLGFPVSQTPFGLDYETGKWPAPYANSIFIAMHGAVGSWTGTRVVQVATDANGLPTGTPSDFATGWSLDPTMGVTGRATDVAFAPDGRLFVIDDNSGGIWWIAPESLEVPAGW